MFERSDDVQDGPSLRRAVGLHLVREQPAVLKGQLQLGRNGRNDRRPAAFLQEYVLDEGGQRRIRATDSDRNIFR